MDSLEHIEKIFNDTFTDQAMAFGSVITIAPIGLLPMSFRKRSVTYTCKWDEVTQKSIQSASIEGALMIDADTWMDVVLVVPQCRAYYWQIKKAVQETPSNTSTVRFHDMLTIIGHKEDATFFPAELLNFVDITMTSYVVTFDRLLQQRTDVETVWKPTTNQSWEIIPKVLSLSELSMELNTSHYALRTQVDKTIATLHLTVKGRVTIGAVQLWVSIKMGLYKPWRLTFDSDNLTLGNLAALIVGGNEQSITSLLPKGLLSGSSDIALKRVDIGIDVKKRMVTDVDFTLKQTGVWTIFSAISIYDWSVQMNVAFTEKGTKVRGEIHGFMNLGSAVKLDVSVAIPMGERGCTVQLKKGTTIEFNGIGSLMELVGFDASKSTLPAQLTNLGSCSVDALAITFDPTKASIHSLFLGMQSTRTWVIIAGFLELTEVSVRVSMVHRNQVYESTGVIFAKVSVGKNSFEVKCYKTKATDAWRLKMGTLIPPLHLPGFEQAAAWLMPATLAQRIPSTLMPFGKGFDMTAMDIEFNLSTTQLEALSFRIVNSAPWVVIDRYLILDKAFIDARITDRHTERKMALALGAKLTVGAAVIDFNATYSSDQPWKLMAALSKPVSFNLDDLLKKLNLNNEFHLPQHIGLPMLVINRLEGWVVPEQKELSFVGDVALIASEAPSVYVMGIQFRMLQLTAAVQLKALKEDPDKQNYRRVSLGCMLNMQALRVAATLQFGSSTIDTVFWGSILSSDFSIAHLGDMLSSNKWGEVTPTDTVQLNYQSGAVAYMNLTQNEMAVCGQLDGFGSALFLAQYMDADRQERGYVFSFTLDTNFQFANLFTALGIIDELITIRRASIVISSYQAPTDQIKLKIADLIEHDNNPLHLVNPIDDQMVSATTIEKGVHLYAQIEFKGWIGSVLKQLSGEPNPETSAALELYAYIASDSRKTNFRATLPVMSLFSGVVTLQYCCDEGRKCSIEGVFALCVFDKKYNFDCRLLIDELTATLSAELYKAAPLPLFQEQLPAVFTLNEFAFAGIYYFDTEQRNKYLELRLNGRVTIVGIDLSATLHLIDSKPVLVYVSLNQNLTLSRLVEELVGGGFHWPSNLLDITFRADMAGQRSLIYYYDQANDNPQHPLERDGRGFTNGYNLQATVDLTLLITVSFELSINMIKGEGLTASASLLSPISLFIIQLAGTQKTGDTYSGGPSVYIRTDSDGKVAYGLRAGINFCGTAIATADVALSKDADNQTAIAVRLGATTLPVLGNVVIGFSYSKRVGFKIDDIPAFDFLYELKDLADKVKKIVRMNTCSVDVCAVLSKFACSLLYKNNYQFSPSIAEVEGKGYSMVLNGKFQLLTMADVEVCSIDFKNLIVIPLEQVAGLSSLGEMIAGVLGEVVTSILESLFADKEQFALLLGVFFAEQATQIAGEMLCRGLIDSATSSAVSSAAASSVSASSAAAASAAQIASAAAIAAGASAAAAKAAGTAAASAATAAGAGITTYFITKIVKKVKEEIDKDPDPKPKPDPDPKPDPEPGIPVLQADDITYVDGCLRVQWRGASYAAGYELSFFNPDGTQLGDTLSFAVDQLSGRSNKLEVGKFNGGTYVARVRSTRGQRRSDWSAVQIDKLVMPTDLSCRVENNNVTVRWSAVANAVNYHLALTDSSRVVIDKQTISNATQYNFKVTAEQGMKLSISVYADAPHRFLESEVAYTDLLRWDTPVITDFRWNSQQETLLLTIEKVDEVENRIFDVQIIENNTQQVALHREMTSYTVEFGLIDFNTSPIGIYRCEVKTLCVGNHYESLPAKGGTLVEIASSNPLITSFVKEGNEVVVTWMDNQSEVKMYQLEIAQTSTFDVVVVAQADIRYEGKKAFISVSKFTVAQAYYARIRLYERHTEQVLQNGDGTHDFDSWTLSTNRSQWYMGRDAEGCSGSEGNSCFSTLHSNNSKWQRVDLSEFGCTDQALRCIESIEVCDWIYSATPATYRLEVKLSDREGKVIEYFDSRCIETSCGLWKKVSYRFTTFDSEIRYIDFIHSGIDVEQWYIPFGCKMTGARIQVSFIDGGVWTKYPYALLLET